MISGGGGARNRAPLPPSGAGAARPLAEEATRVGSDIDVLLAAQPAGGRAPRVEPVLPARTDTKGSKPILRLFRLLLSPLGKSPLF